MKGRWSVKGRIEATIPQRQFENLRVCYEFEGEEEKKIAYKAIINDCLKYHHFVKQVADNTEDKVWNDVPKPGSGK